MFDKVYSQRLTILADHLESGKLGQDKFDISQYHKEDLCGSVGCALGELPHIFPNDWWYWGSDPILKKPNDIFPSTSNSTQEWFGITTDEDYHLFYSGNQITDKYGGKHLTESATPQQVAANIRAFLEYKAREAQKEEKG